MGLSFSAIQIKNKNKISPNDFKELLSKYFEKKGLVPADSDTVQFSCRLAFSEKSDWVTLACPEYEPGGQAVKKRRYESRNRLKPTALRRALLTAIC